ncbi:MAG: hypothetical protein A2X49_02120 [Lentisphaerae bacterium GWF2_52_8]|nr:MAG: hypothetical protein A2X49_02120 [Lentisphaerae bacterium GWF2_52_8]
MKALEIELNHNYKQFDGLFYYWLYISLDEDYYPKFIKFFLPDGRVIFTATEAIYFTAAKCEKKGVDSIKGTRCAELLSTAYLAADVFIDVSKGKWHEKIIEHACQYYETDTLFIKSIGSPLATSSEAKYEYSLINIGIIKLLLLRKTEESAMNIYG